MARPYNETGFSQAKPRDQTCDNLVNFVKPLVELESGHPYKQFSCVHYMEKPTYGTNYKVKVETDRDYLHLHLYTPPVGEAQVNLIERGRRYEDDLAIPFDLRSITSSLKAGSFYNYS